MFPFILYILSHLKLQNTKLIVVYRVKGLHAHLIILSSIHPRHHKRELCTLHSVQYINQAPGVNLSHVT